MTTILAAVCCSLLFLTVFLDGTESASCCLRYSNQRLRCKDLDHYSLQNIHGSCDIPAVIFHVHKPAKKFVCADPSRKWTNHVMRCLDNKRTSRVGKHS